MQVVETSIELNAAMETVENILNEEDGKHFLEILRKYKQTKKIDEYTLLKLRYYLEN